MADIPAELGLKVAEGFKPPPTPDIKATIVQGVESHIKEGKVREATEDVSRPGRVLETSEMVSRYEGLFKPDSIDQQGNLVSSQEQQNRITEGKKVMGRLKAYAEAGYSKMTPAEQNLLKKDVADLMFNHQAYRALAQAQGIDLTNPTFRLQCEKTAEAMLKNPQMWGMTRDKIADFMATAAIDYTQFTQALENQQQSSQKLTKLKDELGDPTKGLTKEVADLEKNYESKYQRKRDPNDPNNLLYGTEIQARNQKENEIRTQRAELNKYAQVFELVQKSVTKIAQGNIQITYTDPETGQQETLTGNDDYFGLLNNWAQKLTEIQGEIQKNEDIVKVIEEEQETARAGVDKKREQKESLEKEIKQEEENQNNLENQTKEAHNAVVSQEEEINNRLAGIVTDATTDMWVSGKAAVEETQATIVATKEEQVYKDIQKKLYTDIYDQAKKQFKTAQFQSLIKNLLNAPVGQGVEGFGIVCLNNFVSGLPPNSELRPFVEGMKNDPAKLKEFSVKITTDALKLAAYKDPKSLEGILAADEALMRSLQGDILPGILTTAMSNPEGQALVEQMIGAKLVPEQPEVVKKTLRERLAGMGGKKTLGILLALMALLGVGLFRAAKG